MHYHCEVWVPVNKNIEEQLTAFMAPYYKGNECDSNSNGDYFWDWYQIGGRWKGKHVSDYDPNSDPEHVVTCYMCNGTGHRPDIDPKEKELVNVCNVCCGNGVQILWPTGWEPHPKDVIPISEIPDGFDCYTLVLPNKVLHREEYHPKAKEKFQPSPVFPKGNVNTALADNGVTNGFLVTVDYHC